MHKNREADIANMCACDICLPAYFLCQFFTYFSAFFSQPGLTRSLKRPVPYAIRDHHENERADDEEEIYFPAEPDPGAVIYSAHGELD